MNYLTYLKETPQVGMVSGFGGSLLLAVQNILLDESILKIVAGIGVWFGVVVAGLTCVLKLIELAEKLFKRSKS